MSPNSRHKSKIALLWSMSVNVKLCVNLRTIARFVYPNVRWSYCIAISILYALCNKSIAAIDHSLWKMCFTKTEQKCRIESETFRRIGSSPIVGIIGALVGINIEIRQPPQCDVPDTRKYYNRKGLFAVVVQEVTFEDSTFWSVSAKHAVSTLE